MNNDQAKRLSHDVRGALTTAMLVAERLQSHSDPAVVRYAGMIAQAIETATSAVRAGLQTIVPAPPQPGPPPPRPPQPGWDPTQYLRFSDERMRPALDLMERIDSAAPGLVIDLGCGPGNVTQLLSARWPQARLIGVDASGPMLARAQAALPGASFIKADIATWTPDAKPDVIYSNAALHWLPDHSAVFPRLLSLLAPGGLLAVQMPLMHDAPFRTLIPQVAAKGPWAAALAHVAPVAPILSPDEYWDMIRPHVTALDIWETTYRHALEGDDAVMQWASGTSLRPFLDALHDEGMRHDFRQAYAEALRPFYPRRADGTTSLPFHRLFIVGRV